MQCPSSSFGAGPHNISKRPDGNFKCSCGCLFEWQDDFHWKILEPKKLCPYCHEEYDDYPDHILTQHAVNCG